MLIIILILLGYSLLVTLLIYGWNKSIKQQIQGEIQKEKFISVIIPFRNEEQHIEKLLASLAAQTYLNFEIIAVDDHSTDQSLKFFKATTLNNLQLLTNPGDGKKSAVTHGVLQAKGDVIVATDADCIVTADWLRSINVYFQNDRVVMLFGAVRLRSNKTFFSILQSIEFASLIGSGAATAAMHKPIMCNGANLAYLKSVFMEVNGYEGNQHIASGDDEFLMRKIFKLYPTCIQFAGSSSAIVETQTQPDMRSFLMQRIRWASKWKGNSSAYTVALAFFIFASQVASLWCLISLLTSVSFIPLSLLLVKALLECIFLIQVCRFLKVRWNWLAFIVLQLVYPIYVIGIGIVSNFVAYSWKDRKIR